MTKKEEYAYLLDYLSRGYSSSYKRQPIAQALGKSYFTLLELVVKEDRDLNLEQEVYVGPDEREDIKYIKGRLKYTNLTSTAQSELDEVIKKIIQEDEEKFIKFFNKAGAISTRRHSLELLPSIGKKHMKAILNARKQEKFKSLDDVKERVKLMPNPVKATAERVEKELRGGVRHYLFARPPKQERNQ